METLRFQSKKQLCQGWVCLIVLCFYVTLTAQHISLLSVDEGLPQSFVSGIVEDEEGFIWTATRNGLARYDGHRFKVFQHQPNNPESLASNFISHLSKGAENILWIRYENGELDMFDVRTEKSHHIITTEFLRQHQIKVPRRNWLATADSTFWFVSYKKNVLSSFNYGNVREKEIIQNYPINDNIYGLLEDKKGEVWVLSDTDILKQNSDTGQFDATAIPYSLDFYTIDESPDIHERNNGELMWIDKKNIYFFNPEKKTFRKIKSPEKSDYNTKWIHTGPDGKEYFEINKSVYSYDDLSGVVRQAYMNIGSNRETQAFLVDKSGLIWVGPNTDGIYKIDLSTSFSSFTYQEGFLADLLKREFHIEMGDYFELEEIKKQSLSPAYYMRSVTHNQKLWIALSRQVIFYDFNSRKSSKVSQLPVVREDDTYVPISGITITEEGNPLVIDQKNNLYIYKPKEEKWIPFTIASLPEPYDIITPNNIFIDKHKLWITTDANGLILMDIFKNKIKNITKEAGLPTDNLLELHPDLTREDILWIGSSQGLIQLNKNTYEIEVFSVEEGLPDNVIYSIYGDKSGYLWLGTNKGLCSFHSTSHKHRTFNKQHGLSGSEFNRFHKLQLPDEKVAFGGINSGVIFDPLFIKEDKFNPHSAITQIKLNNVDIKKKYSSLKYNRIDSLSLPYNENSITIEFTALQFSQPQDIVYRYRLKGYDNEWINVGNKREAVYTKIPPGNYLFEVNATNTTGEWSDHIKTITLSISPPIWNTWWAWVCYFLVVSLSTGLLINYRIRQKVITKERDLKSKEAAHLRKLDELKTQFFSNITHELRTPLSLIIGPAEMLKNKNNKQEQHRLLSIISKNADSLLDLSNQLLDIAKLEAGVLKPKMLWGDVSMVVRKTVRAFSEAASSKQVTIALETPEKAEYFFSPNTLERILSNLISNALKFSDTDGKINISLIETRSGITLKVKDNGRGIPKGELPDIFKRFYKGNDKKRQAPGTGIGLSLVNDLVELHQGSIIVKSNTKPPTGTKFLVFLPFEKAVITGIPKEGQLEEAEIPLVEDDDDKPTILVVEDNEELANFIKLSLQSVYNIIMAENGSKGMEKAIGVIPDLIVSDVLMDDMDGFELCKALKQNINTSHIPILLLTAKSDTESKLEGLSLGADDYITKPFHVPELMMRIDNRLALEKRQREYLYKELNLLPKDDETLNGKAVHNEFFDHLHQVIDDYLEDESFNVEKLASALNMSRTSLHRKIKSMTDMTTGEIIKTYRLQIAISLLHQHFNISEVAYKTGFGSPSYFSKCFKETYDLTPTEYLQKNKLHQK